MKPVPARAGPALSAEERRLVGVVGLTFLLNQYDMGLLGLALPQIQADLGVPEAGAGPLVAAVRLGTLAAVGLALAADRVGRRRLLLATLLGFSAATALTAAARTPVEFALLQLAARACIAAEEVVAIVIVAEELDARARGLGFGVLAVFGALGHGLAAAAYGAVDLLPFGWRGLYAVAALPLLGVAWIRRGLRETRRFEDARLSGAVAGPRLEPLRELVRSYPGRLAALIAAIGAFGFVATTALAFVSKTLQEVHGYAPHQVTLLYLGGGAAALVGYPLAGVLADRFGRRRVLAASLLANAAGIAWFYQTSGASLVPAWIGMMIGFMAADVLFGALGSELFATSHRATASGVRMIALGAGGALGLAVEGLLYPQAGAHPTALAWMTPAALVAPLVILLALPETAARELEEIAPLRAAGGR